MYQDQFYYPKEKKITNKLYFTTSPKRAKEKNKQRKEGTANNVSLTGLIYFSLKLKRLNHYSKLKKKINSKLSPHPLQPQQPLQSPPPSGVSGIRRTK